MPIETVEALLNVLRTCGLLPREQYLALAAEVRPLGDDLAAVVKHVLKTERLTVYQLRKVLHGKAAELFLGPYVILDRLGEGGMGRVYRARQTRVGREVALKVVRPSLLASPIVRARYQREVEAAAALRHPNIVAVEDAGEADGKFYLAMEFVDGIDLSLLTRDHRPLEVVEACEYARQTALGLKHAHEAGFVHRDIKPSNIVVAGERFVPQATEPSVVKILDMGLIRAIGFEEVEHGGELVRGGPGGAAVTRDGSVVGTPDYMAPEQVKNSSTVDHRADLYSLGCTLYFLLTGRPPFAEAGTVEKLHRHQVDPPPPLQALRPDVPGAVAAVVARLMAKNPDDRFPTAAAAAEALAPLSVYPSGSKPVPIRVRRGPSPSSAETLSPSERSTVPTDEPAEVDAQSNPDAPHRADARKALHAAIEALTPSALLSDPPSMPYAPVARPDPQAPRQPARRPTPAWVWVALALGIVASGLGLCLGLIGR